MEQDDQREFRSGDDAEWGMWRPSVAPGRVRRRSRTKADTKPYRQPRLWSYTNRSPYDYDIHRLLFSLTVRHIRGRVSRCR